VWQWRLELAVVGDGYTGARGGDAGLAVCGAFRPVKTLNSVVEHVEGLQVA